jgi:hypothetical protein
MIMGGRPVDRLVPARVVDAAAAKVYAAKRSNSAFHVMQTSAPLLVTLFWGAVALISLPTQSAGAQAPDAKSCEAVQRTEAMRAAGQYRAARARLLECVNAECGGDVRRRCATVLQKLDAVTPSIVVRAQLADGNDATDVSVRMENEQLASSLNGMAIAVDPGEHQLVFERAGLAPVSQTVTIREGEKFRAIDVQLEPSLPAPSSAQHERGSSAFGPDQRVAVGGTLIGVGVVGLGAFTLLGLKAREDEKELERQNCKPYCGKAFVESVRTRYVLSNISLGVGVLALGSATWMLVTGFSKPSTTVSDLAGLSIVAGSDGGLASYSHSF